MVKVLSNADTCPTKSNVWQPGAIGAISTNV